MKKLIVLFSVLWISATVSAQSEIKNDSLTLSMGQNKMFGDFILDGSLFTMAVKQLPSLADLLKTAPSMDGLLQSINQPPAGYLVRHRPTGALRCSTPTA
jgi:hypothetical protein